MCYKMTMVLALLILCCVEFSSTGPPSQDDEKKTIPDKFVATSEWQKVEKGQPLPAGLHYRLNINTGETEVKLLESDDSSESIMSKTGLVALPPEEVDGSTEDTFYMSKEELKKVLSDIPAEDIKEDSTDSDMQTEPSGKEKYRSYEELKKEFGSLNLTVKTDMEILNELVSKAREYLTKNDEEAVTISTLKDLEYLVHQIDNAREFIRLGGLTHVIVPALNSSSPEIRAESLWLLGSASQSNPKVQIAVLNAGIMSKLVKATVLDSDASVHARAIYALSCLIRQFPAAQMKLVEEGGLASLSSIIDSKRSSDFKTKMRVITLVNDLLLERALLRKAVEEIESVDFSSESKAVQNVQQHKQRELKEKLRQYDAINLEKRLVEDGWCHKLSEFLWKLHESGANSGRTQKRDDLGSVISKDVPFRPEHDAVEKVLSTLLAMKKICLNEFQTDTKLETVLRAFLLWYQDLSIREEVLLKHSSKIRCSESDDSCLVENDLESRVDDSEMYYTSIAELLKELIDILEEPYRARKGGKEEL